MSLIGLSFSYFVKFHVFEQWKNLEINWSFMGIKVN